MNCKASAQRHWYDRRVAQLMKHLRIQRSSMVTEPFSASVSERSSCIARGQGTSGSQPSAGRADVLRSFFTVVVTASKLSETALGCWLSCSVLDPIASSMSRGCLKQCK
jgi:hypothetical protein